MGNLLFSPSGRIGPSQFMKGATVLIVISLVFALLPIVSPALGALGIIGLIFIYCWVALWIKRYHDAGKSGWMCLIPIVVYLVAAVVVSQVVAGMFTDPEAAAAIEEAAAAGDLGAIFSASMTGGLTTTGLIANAISAAAVSYGVAFLFNNLIKQDPGDNQFGPVPGTAAADTFN